MGRLAKVLCLHCEAKMPLGAAYCPSCEHPTVWATHEQRVAWEVAQWRQKRAAVPERALVASAPRAPVHRARIPARRPEPPAPRVAAAPPPRVVEPSAPRVVEAPPPRVEPPPPPRVARPSRLAPPPPPRAEPPPPPRVEPVVRAVPPLAPEPHMASPFFMPPSGIVDAIAIPAPVPDPCDVMLEEIVARLREVHGQVAALDARVEALLDRRRPVRLFRRARRYVRPQR